MPGADCLGTRYSVITLASAGSGVLALLGRAGTVASWEGTWVYGSAAETKLQQHPLPCTHQARPWEARDPDLPAGVYAFATAASRWSKKKKNKAEEAQASERQSVLFLIEQSYLISARAFQFPHCTADTRLSCCARRSHRPTAPKAGLEPRSFVSLRV